MMAGFDNQTVLPTTELIYPVIMTIDKSPSNVDNSYLWLIDSAASSQISGNKDLFHSMHSIPPIKIDIANGESFTVNQWGTINLRVASDPCWELDDIHITLTDVIYAPNLRSNLLLVGVRALARLDLFPFSSPFSLYGLSYCMPELTSLTSYCAPS